MNVLPLPTTLYAQWRVASASAARLRESRDVPEERLLQAIWQHQRLRRAELNTLDGRTARILHPGFLNREGGPDFHGAVIQFNDDPPKSGDVEVDIYAGGWRAHAHDRNPAFQNVILHVIWETPRVRTDNPPKLVIRDKLDAPLDELGLWLNAEASETFPVSLRGRCSAPLQELSGERLLALLREAAQIRFQAKAFQIKARAQAVGWDQALCEGMFRALGYKHNAWPMQNLAEQRERWARQGTSRIELQARLLGVAGLLPPELTRSQSVADGYLRRAWDQWWRERDEFSDCILPRSIWRFHGLRPANHPQRRIALAAHWFLSGDLIPRIEQWSAKPADESSLDELLAILRSEQDDFWDWHWTLRSARLKKRQPLLGATRVTELAINAILPWLWARASESDDAAARHAIEARFYAWPAAEDNSVLRLARRRLLGEKSGRVRFGAAEQQGLIQIVRDFCEHSNAICDDCQFPGLVKTAQCVRLSESIADHE